MNIPNLKRMASKYQDAYGKYRRKGIEEDQKELMEVYQKEDRGQWDLHKQQEKDSATPLVAVRRAYKGFRGQQVGTIATSPKEVDSIIRKVYGDIYKGNGEKEEDPEEFAKKHMKDHDEWNSHQPGMSIGKLTGEGVEEAVQQLKETAGVRTNGARRISSCSRRRLAAALPTSSI